MDERVSVVNSKTGVKLVGQNAPLRSELAYWLSTHANWKPAPESHEAGRPRGPMTSRDRLMRDAQEKADMLWKQTMISAERRVADELGGLGLSPAEPPVDLSERESTTRQAPAGVTASQDVLRSELTSLIQVELRKLESRLVAAQDHTLQAALTDAEKRAKVTLGTRMQVLTDQLVADVWSDLSTTLAQATASSREATTHALREAEAHLLSSCEKSIEDAANVSSSTARALSHPSAATGFGKAGAPGSSPAASQETFSALGRRVLALHEHINSWDPPSGLRTDVDEFDVDEQIASRVNFGGAAAIAHNKSAGSHGGVRAASKHGGNEKEPASDGFPRLPSTGGDGGADGAWDEDDFDNDADAQTWIEAK